MMTLARRPLFRHVHLHIITKRMRPRPYSDLAALSREMLNRPERIIEDYVTPTPMRLLQTTLADVMTFDSLSGELGEGDLLPEGFHFAYFPPNDALSSLSPDGTDPMHSPGAPFTRRMWAGGSLRFGSGLRPDRDLYHLKEKIVDIRVKGQGENEKVFVTLHRVVESKSTTKGLKETPCVTEHRILVFLRDVELASYRSKPPAKVLTPSDKPDFSCTLTPTRELLFRFSALTWNAHAIHLDQEYCQKVEGHRNLLVHGPLTLVLMLQMTRHFLVRGSHAQKRISSQAIRHVEYKNLAPLYAEEPMKVCIKAKGKQGDGTYMYGVWIENDNGGYAVKGTVYTHDHLSH